MNESLFFMLNGLGATIPSEVWVNITNLGDTSVALSLMIFIYRFDADRTGRLLIVAVTATVATQGLKHYFEAPRPPAVLVEGSFRLIGDSITTLSFPSGHTATAFVIAGILIAQYRRWYISLLALLVASLVGLSRIMIGVHWPADVFFGAILGLAVGYLVYRISQTQRLNGNFLEWLGGITVLAILTNQLIYEMPYSEYTGVQLSKYLFTAAAIIGFFRFLRATPLLQR